MSKPTTLKSKSRARASTQPKPKAPAPKPKPERVKGPILHDDGLRRCPWAGNDPLYMAYHDEEWGVPEYDDRALFEKLILDGFQAGLSWITILRKRDNFRKAFDDFDPARIARYSDRKVEALMNDAGIIRNRAKITGTIGSAKAYLKIMKGGPGSFSKMLWDHVGGKPKINSHHTVATIPVASPQSMAMSKELLAHGFKFVGPTIVYAFMQATGMVNDHLVDCHCYDVSGKRSAKRKVSTQRAHAT
jgi:DNA-3-methyladenine glycosylase I